MAKPSITVVAPKLELRPQGIECAGYWETERKDRKTRNENYR